MSTVHRIDEATIGQLHSDSLEEELRSRAVRHAREQLPTLLERLSTLGFSWRDIAKLAGVSVPAVRKWRQGESATGDNRQRVARIVALCEIAAQRFHIADVAGWLETPLHPDAPLNGLDLMASERFDLVLALAHEQPGDPERVLDEFEPDWRARYRSDVEVFTASDGMPALRLTDDVSIPIRGGEETLLMSCSGILLDSEQIESRELMAIPRTPSDRSD